MNLILILTWKHDPLIDWNDWMTLFGTVGPIDLMYFSIGDWTR